MEQAHFGVPENDDGDTKLGNNVYVAGDALGGVHEWLFGHPQIVVKELRRPGGGGDLELG